MASFAPSTVNTKQDFLPLKGTDHVEFYVGNARQAAYYYRTAFGMSLVAYAGPETGQRDRASYMVQQGKIRFVFTTSLRPGSAIADHVAKHGDGVRVIALEVEDARQAWIETTSRGARSIAEPTETADEHGRIITSSIAAYGDTIHTFVERGHYNGPFLPGFRAEVEDKVARPTGLKHVDHMVGNVGWHAMDEWVDFYANVMGFQLYQHFDDKDISTEYSALMSKVMSNGNGYVKFPINEPAEGRRKSQIEEYLDFYQGPGVQHIALATDDILSTVSLMQQQASNSSPSRTPTTPNSPPAWAASTSQSQIWSGSAFSSIETMRATCCKSSPAPSKTAPRCSTRSSSARAAVALARATSKRSLKPSSGSRRSGVTSDGHRGRTTENRTGPAQSRAVFAHGCIVPHRAGLLVLHHRAARHLGRTGPPSHAAVGKARRAGVS